MDFETAQRIERLEQQVALLYQHLGLNGSEEYQPPAPFLPPPPVPGEPQDMVVGYPGDPGILPGPPQYADPRLPPEFYAALQSGKMINAIKVYREVTGVGLKEAKDQVEAMAGKHKRR
jgi:Ribosomal protein L7/L12 C-terminal domain